MSAKLRSLYRHVGKRIAELRRAQGFTQERLAEKVGLSPGYFARVEAGARDATIDVLMKIADALDEPVRDLLPGAEIQPMPRELAKVTRNLPEADVALLVAVARRLGAGAAAASKKKITKTSKK